MNRSFRQSFALGFGLLGFVLIVILSLALFNKEIMFILFGTDRVNFGILIIISFSTVGLLFGLYNVFELRTRFPQALSIALIGPSGSGKTVYLTMLFKWLESGNLKGLFFSSSGMDTIKKVAEYLNLMASGRFPPRTYIGDHFLYQAIANYGTSIFSRRYRLQIADYAGEHLNITNQDKLQDKEWFQDTDYFSYVIKSDAILIMIDYPRIMGLNESNPFDLAFLQNILVAALTVLVETKNTNNPSLRLTTPVGIIISQMDQNPNFLTRKIPSSYDVTQIRNNLDRLITFCEMRCKYFRIFYISSLGSHHADHWRLGESAPVNITEPISWILGAG